MRATAVNKRKRSLLGQAGFTLLEFSVSLGFMAAMGGLIAGSSFLALRTDVETGALAHVAVETAKTTRWMVRDIHRAGQDADDSDGVAPTDLVDGAAAVNAAAFSWDDGGPDVTCTYSLNGTDLQRDCGGGSVAIVGRSISGLEFVLSGRLVTVSYTITPPEAPDKAEQIVLNIALGGG